MVPRFFVLFKARAGRWSRLERHESYRRGGHITSGGTRLPSLEDIKKRTGNQRKERVDLTQKKTGTGLVYNTAQIERLGSTREMGLGRGSLRLGQAASVSSIWPWRLLARSPAKRMGQPLD